MDGRCWVSITCNNIEDELLRFAYVSSVSVSQRWTIVNDLQIVHVVINNTIYNIHLKFALLVYLSATSQSDNR